MHGSWQSALPSRFINEIPEEHVDTVVDEGFYGGYAGFRDNARRADFASTYDARAGNAPRPTAPLPAACARARR